MAAALAADWPRLQGTEAADAPAVRAWGFVQALGEGVAFGPPAPAFENPDWAAFEGQRPLFNRVGSGDASWGFSIRRARLGLRGAIPKTAGRVAYQLAAEFGTNGLTRQFPVQLTDASVTLSYIPGVHLRFGQFKLPTGEEALEANPVAAEFVEFSEPTRQLLLESRVEDGVVLGGVSAFRDVGLEAFGSFAVGRGEFGYAAMLSNGRMGGFDLDDSKDFTVRLAWSPVVWGEATAARRDELGMYAFWQQGGREVDGERAPRIRRGGGVKIEKDGWRARVEVIEGTGWIDLGASPPFPGQPVRVAARGQAIGGHAMLHFRRGLGGGSLRYDTLWRSSGTPADERLFHTLTLDAQLILNPHVRVMADYAVRWLAAPKGSDDARALAATLGDRVSLQVVASF